MMTRYCLIFILTVVGCSSQPSENSDIETSSEIRVVKQEVDTAYGTESQLLNESVLTIDDKCAVLISPDSNEVKILFEKFGEENFYASSDDNSWYQSEAREFLDSMGLKVVDTDVHLVNFKVKNRIIASIATSVDSFAWGAILFNGVDEPEIIDITDVESEYHSYFGK